MDWSAQTNEMMKSWGDAQKQLWSGWMSWGQGAANMGQGAPAFDPTQFFRMGADTWSGLKEGPAQRLTGTILGTPEVMTRSMNLLMKAWQAVAPKLEQGKAWQPDLQTLLDQWRQEVASMPERASTMGGDFSQLTKTLFERWTPMTAPWLSMVGQATASGHPAAAFLGGTTGSDRALGMGEAFQMMGGMFQGAGDMPRATVAREKMGKFLKVFDAVSDLNAAKSEYQKSLSDGIAKSVERTMEHLATLAGKGEKVTSARELMKTWYSIADRTLMETFNTAEFMEIQEKLTVALMNHKMRQREALEVIYEQLEIPTRSEIDEAYKDIHSLKQEVRVLKKALKEVGVKSPPAKLARKHSKEGAEHAPAKEPGVTKAAAS